MRLIQGTGTLPGRGAPRCEKMIYGIVPPCLEMWELLDEIVPPHLIKLVVIR